MQDFDRPFENILFEYTHIYIYTVKGSMNILPTGKFYSAFHVRIPLHSTKVYGRSCLSLHANHPPTQSGHFFKMSCHFSNFIHRNDICRSESFLTQYIQNNNIHANIYSTSPSCIFFLSFFFFSIMHFLFLFFFFFSKKLIFIIRCVLSIL